LLEDLNINLAAPLNKRDNTIAEQVDAMALIDMTSHFCQQRGRRSQGQCVCMSGLWLKGEDL
jgi:hypothetical protein